MEFRTTVNKPTDEAHPLTLKKE